MTQGGVHPVSLEPMEHEDENEQEEETRIDAAGVAAGKRWRREKADRKQDIDMREALSSQFGDLAMPGAEKYVGNTRLSRRQQERNSIDKELGIDLKSIRKAKDKSKHQIRSRDGKIVSSKGEKYVAAPKKPEWDGGSRGRVTSKGKRGRGIY